MSSRRWFALIATLFALAFALSGALYLRSRSADFDAHARAIETFGRVRHLDRQMAQQVLAARFGLLNQYDPLTGTEVDLANRTAELEPRLAAVLPIDSELERALRELQGSVGERRSAIDRFKAENSVLKNSLRYLPTAVEEVRVQLGSNTTPAIDAGLHALVKTVLVYNLIGDRSTRDNQLEVVHQLGAARGFIAPEITPDFDLLLAHARVIAERQPSVDELMRKASNTELSQRLDQVEALYNARFSQAAATANGYRRVLYVWSLCMVLAAALAGVQLLRLYTGLEQRVKERTAELGRALEALWGEMKLARKIQEALVPAAPTLAGCEVAASMKPADEVGGDYYDVIHANGHEWILIGDVSGHGVPAGLIMMMCQTAVRTALQCDPDLTPDRLLVLVNAVLTQNIRQLGEDKYMTITALRRDPNGKIAFAGAHQDMFVYRADTDEVESFETAGLWLGLKADATGGFRTRTLEMGARDVLVLLTDGVTEAVRDGEMFDVYNVRRVMSGAKGKSAREVLDAVLQALEGYEISDDATLLIIRQMAGAEVAARPNVPSHPPAMGS
ncbi:MAG TPA: DAHL domain-containing protein [Polyangiales bacterium]|nr:DAHL domain-containing protein [Polyangiales bacterium]